MRRILLVFFIIGCFYSFGQTNVVISPNDTTICVGETINFVDQSTGTNISSWDWTFNGATPATSTNQNPSNITYNTAGDFYAVLEITDDNGTDKDSVKITVIDCTNGPTADFSTPNQTICVGDCISFTDQSVGTNITAWVWTFKGAETLSSTDTDPKNICYQTPGTYDVILNIKGDNGTDADTLKITVKDCPTPPSAPTAAFTMDTLIVCQGDCISFTDQSLGNPTQWKWEFQGANTSLSQEQNPTHICYDSAGTFMVKLTVSNAVGTDQATNPVKVLPAPKINGFGDTLIDMGGVANLEAKPVSIGTVFWTPSDRIDCEACLKVKASPLITTTYYPSIIDANGCVGRDTVIVKVKFHEVIEVPSAFSPNGDGLNDTLHVLGVGIRTVEFRVYNRYGQLVFKTSNINKGWDGTYHGEPLNQGVFAYTVRYSLINGVSGEKSGNVTLIK